MPLWAFVYRQAWERVPSSRRGALLSAARDSAREMRKGIRATADSAVTTMVRGVPGKKRDKLTVIHASELERADWQKQTEAVFPKIRGKLVSARGSVPGLRYFTATVSPAVLVKLPALITKS